MPPPPDAGLRSVPLTRGRLRARRLLAAGVALLAVALAAAALFAFGDDEPDTLTVGRVLAADGGATVRSGSRTSELGVDTEIEVGDVVHAPASGAVAVALEGGGSVRFDSGARLTFIDEAVDGETGEREGASRPVVEVLAGRAWVNPPEGVEIEVALQGGRVTSAANPMAIECPGDCQLQAPAGGVTLDADSGADATPSPTEVVDLRPDGAMSLRVSQTPTAWTQQNLDADRNDGLTDPEPVESGGVLAAAVLDANYAMRFEVVGEPQGEAIPDSLRHPAGTTYSLSLSADGNACPPTSCQAPLSAPDDGDPTSDNGSGTADVGDATVAITFTQSLNCKDESNQSVVVPNIGTTTVTATLTVASVVQEGARWRIATASGTGSVATTLATACNPGDVLGTSTSPTSVALG